MSQNQCIAQSRRAIDQKALVDIGVMQVNWYWHQHRFSSLTQAWQPMVNLQVGAEILRECFEQTHDWWQAVGHYHAPNHAKRAEAYRRRVKQQWRQHH